MDKKNMVEQPTAEDSKSEEIEVIDGSGSVVDADEFIHEPTEEEQAKIEAEKKEYVDNIHRLARQTPGYLGRTRRFRRFTVDEQKVLAAGLATGIPLYRLAQTLHIERHNLVAYIERDPVLTQIRKDWQETEKDKVEEGIQTCVDRCVPAVLMWKAERLIPNKYGMERQLEEEDDTKLVFGDISEENLREADRILEEASKTAPTTGISAMLEVSTGKAPEVSPLADEIKKENVMAGAEVSPMPLDKTLPAPALNPGDDKRFTQYSEATATPQAMQTSDFVDDSPPYDDGSEEYDTSADFV